MTPKYTLFYFKFAGKAETIRLLLHGAGIEFTDNRIESEEWKTMKEDSKFYCSPYGDLDSTLVDKRRFYRRTCSSLPISLAFLLLCQLEHFNI